MAISSRYFWRRACAQDQNKTAPRRRRLISEPFEQRHILTPLAPFSGYPTAAGGKILFTGSDTTTGEELLTLIGHTSAVDSALFWLDGNALVAAATR
jgi:hypothetical protein